MKTQKKSSQVIISTKVPVLDKDEMDRGILAFVGAVGLFFSGISGIIGLEYMSDIDTSNYVTMGIVESSILLGTGGVLYSKNIMSELSVIGKFKFKDYLKMMNPLKSRVNLTPKPIPMSLSGITENSSAPYLVYQLDNKLSANTTHEVTPQLVKSLKGIRVEQVFEEVPGETWDKAFTSVSRIHEFEK